MIVTVAWAEHHIRVSCQNSPHSWKSSGRDFQWFRYSPFSGNFRFNPTDKSLLG